HSASGRRTTALLTKPSTPITHPEASETRQHAVMAGTSRASASNGYEAYAKPSLSGASSQVRSARWGVSHNPLCLGSFSCGGFQLWGSGWVVAAAELVYGVCQDRGEYCQAVLGAAGGSGEVDYEGVAQDTGEAAG